MLLDTKEVKKQLNIGKTLFEELINEGELPYIQHKAGGKRYFRQEDIDDYIMRHTRRKKWNLDN